MFEIVPDMRHEVGARGVGERRARRGVALTAGQRTRIANSRAPCGAEQQHAVRPAFPGRGNVKRARSRVKGRARGTEEEERDRAREESEKRAGERDERRDRPTGGRAGRERERERDGERRR